MTISKRIISLLVVAAMLVVAVPIVVFATGESTAYVAELNGENYESVADAVAAAANGDTVNIIADTTISAPISIDKSITLNGGGYTLTYTGSDRAIDVPSSANGADLTVKSLTVVAPNAQRGINYNTTGSLTLEGVTVTGSGEDYPTYALNFPGSSDGANVGISSSVLKGLIAINIWGENITANITASDLYSYDFSDVEDYGAIYLSSDGTVMAEGTVVNVVGGSITATDESGNAKPAVCNWTSTGVVNISDTTVVNGTDLTVVAVIGYAGYTSLSDAIADAKDGNTVTLLRDVTTTDAIVIDKSITLDGNGKTVTYAGTGDRVFDTTADAGDVDVTYTNITIAAKCQRGINYNTTGSLTLEGVTVTGIDGKYATYAVNFPAKSNGATVEIASSKLEGRIALNIWGSDMTVNVSDSAIYSIDSSDTDDYSAIQLNTSADGTVVNVVGGTISATDTNGTTNDAICNWSATGAANVSDTTIIVGNSSYVVATIGASGFRDIVSALEYAQPGDTVTLIRDCAVPALESGVSELDVDVSGVTLDLAGYTLTVPKLALVFVGDGFTVKNGTVSGGGASYALWIGGDTPATNVLVEDVVTVGGVNVYNSSDVTLKNVTSTGVGYYAVWADTDVTGLKIVSGTYTGADGKAAILASDESSFEVSGGVFNTAINPAYAAEGYNIATDANGASTAVAAVFEYIGADLREKSSYSTADIRFSYDFGEGVTLVEWGWTFYAASNSSYKKTVDGAYITEDGITRLVVTNLGIANWEKDVCAELWFTVEIDGELVTIHDTVRAANVYGIATEMAAEGSEYAANVISAYDAE
ncbi:MAG: hypothetical protein IJX38_06115 [Clostridia bacterium]|nr:hypothetical protein [Clostridia bacterium]